MIYGISACRPRMLFDSQARSGMCTPQTLWSPAQRSAPRGPAALASADDSSHRWALNCLGKGVKERE